MDRSTLIEKLREIRSKGVNIGIALNTSSRKLKEVYDRLVPRNQNSVPDVLLDIILSKLTIDTVFRLYQKSSIVRKIVEQQSFWRKLIERDWGVVPKFKIDLKLYYLRIDGLRLASRVWSTHPTSQETPIDGFYKRPLEKIVYISSIGFITRDGSFHTPLGDVIHPPPNDRFKNYLYKDPGGLLLTYAGKMIGLDGKEYQLPGSKIKNISQISFGTNTEIIDKQGDVYIYRDGKEIKVELPERILSDRMHLLLGESGNFYQLHTWDGAKEPYSTYTDKMHWYSPYNYHVNNDETIKEMQWLDEKSLPVLSFYQGGIIDAQLRIISNKKHPLGNKILPKRAKYLTNVLQVYSHYSDHIRRLE